MLDEARRDCELEGLRRFARRLGIDSENLNCVLKGRTKFNPSMLATLWVTLVRDP